MWSGKILAEAIRRSVDEGTSPIDRAGLSRYIAARAHQAGLTPYADRVATAPAANKAAAVVFASHRREAEDFAATYLRIKQEERPGI